jgi:hypothetical protein
MSEKIVDPDKERRKIKSDKRMRDIMAAYYMEAKTPREQRGKKIAWITSGGPVEPLHVMDVIPIYPENYGAMIGASKMGVDLCEKAEEMGYARDLCSYARADIASATVNGGPIGGLPEPDMLICCNNICGTVLKWYEVQARYYNVPLFILDTPITHTTFDDDMRRYVTRQAEEYIHFLEKVCGRRLRPHGPGGRALHPRPGAVAGDFGHHHQPTLAHDLLRRLLPSGHDRHVARHPDLRGLLRVAAGRDEGSCGPGHRHAARGEVPPGVGQPAHLVPPALALQQIHGAFGLPGGRHLHLGLDQLDSPG